MQEIPAKQWNVFVRDNNPLLRHEFLSAMEKHQCVGEKFGWRPLHITCYENDELQAAMPLYVKYNSYGEFVFVVENNYSGQLYDLIHSQTKPKNQIQKIVNYSSMAFRPLEISSQIEEAVI